MSMEDYKKTITQLIQKHMVVLGPGIALSIARKIPALKLAGNGDVLAVSGDPKAALDDAADAYIVFAGEISGMILRSVTGEYHGH